MPEKATCLPAQTAAVAALGPRWQPPEAVGQGKTARIEKPNDPSCCALHAVLHSNAGRLAYGFYHFRPAIRPVRPSPVTSSGAASAAAAVATPLGRGCCATCSESGVFAAEMAEAGVRFILTGHVVNNIHTCGPRQRGGWGRGRGPGSHHIGPPALGRHAACCLFFALQACPTGASAMPEASGVTLADGVAGCTFAAAGGQYAGSCMPSPCAPASFWG